MWKGEGEGTGEGTGKGEIEGGGGGEKDWKRWPVGRLLWPGGCPKVGFLAIFERSFCYAMQKSFQLRRNRLVDVNHSTDARRSRLGQGSCRRRNCLGPGTRAVADSTKEGCASQLSAGAAAVLAQEQRATHRFESAASDSAKDGQRNV